MHRLREDPKVYVTRNEQRREYRADIIDRSVDRVNQAMREKYGRADMLVSTIHDSDEVLPIRLLEP